MGKIRQLEDASQQLPGNAVQGMEPNAESRIGQERYVTKNMCKARAVDDATGVRVICILPAMG